MNREYPCLFTRSALFSQKLYSSYELTLIGLTNVSLSM